MRSRIEYEIWEPPSEGREIWSCPHCNAEFCLVRRYAHDIRQFHERAILHHLASHFTIGQLEIMRPDAKR